MGVPAGWSTLHRSPEDNAIGPNPERLGVRLPVVAVPEGAGLHIMGGLLRGGRLRLACSRSPQYSQIGSPSQQATSLPHSMAAANDKGEYWSSCWGLAVETVVTCHAEGLGQP